MIDRAHPTLSISRQCHLLEVSRASVYRRPAPVSADDLRLMELIDRQYLARPFYGSRRMAAWLATQGFPVNRKRVQRLMRLMGLVAIYQRPNTSKAAPEHIKYPYLLGGLTIDRVNQVWCSCLIAPQQSRQSLQSHYTLSRLLRCSENWPRLSAERSRVAGAPRGPGSVRSSRPHRGWGSGAQARSQRRSPASRPRRVRVVGSGQACAGFTVVSAVGTGPPHDGPSRASKVSGAVRDGRRPIGGMASPTSPAGTSQVSDDGRNAGTRRSAHGLYS